MSDGFEDESWAKVGVSAALAKEYEADQRSLLQMLAASFAKLLPNQTQTKTKGLFSGKHVVSLELNLGDYIYTIEDPGSGSLVASRKKTVRGIALKTDTIAVKDCLEELGLVLEAEAQKSSETYRSLSESLGLTP